jgi:hypothetical protein
MTAIVNIFSGPMFTKSIKRKWRRIGHTLRKPVGAIEEDALD